MPLVRDPLTRTLASRYIQAAALLKPGFFVLTNGEHIGSRGVNTLVDNALGQDNHNAYLPGLAAGGVQWQDHFGSVNHPGVSEQELNFLNAVPDKMHKALGSVLQQAPYSLTSEQIKSLLAVVILDNPVSPTININGFHGLTALDTGLDPDRLLALQQTVQKIMCDLMEEARNSGLADSFFVHYAPNLGSGPDGERIKWASGQDTGTTDFQFMLRGAVKEVGVLVILNRYYHQVTGHYPLGESFNAREAPRDHEALLELARDHFDPELMPRIIGVGDTITSQPNPDQPGLYQRGGSDRGFLTLVQQLGQLFHSDNGVIFIDSSGGELNRPAIKEELLTESPWTAVEGITDPQDPLHLNVVFHKGHQQYVDFFCSLAQAR